jgi:hypothetical protein
MKKFILVTLAAILIFGGCAAFHKTAANDSRVLFGNIYGTVTAAETGEPVAAARIYVTDQAVQHLSEKQPTAVRSDQGWIVLPPPETAVRRTSSQPDGAYMLNKIPLTQKYGLYTLVIEAEGLDTLVIDQAPVLPGASMALKIDCRMTATGKAQVIRLFKGHTNVDINYSDQLKLPPK